MPFSRGAFTANPDQTRAITHPPAPLMVVAGAGTGKTTTLIQRIIYLIEEHAIDPATILAITYTEKAAQELKDRILAEVGTAAEPLTVGTFHAFCYSIVREFGYRPEHQPILIEEGDAIFMLLNRFDELGPFTSRELPLDPVRAVSESFLPFLKRLQDELTTPAHITVPEAAEDPGEAEYIAQLHDLLRVARCYKQWKQAANLVDYGDMIQYCYNLLNDHSLLPKLQQRFRHLIIDEFQDNNFALNEIIHRLGGKRQSITVVGDDDQVIFSFRGASAYNISDFRQRYNQHPVYAEITLTENYRSCQPILMAANAVITNNRERITKNLVNPLRPQGSRPHLIQGTTNQQNAALPDLVKDYLDKGFTPGDITILCRTRSQVKEAAHQLELARVPVNVFIAEYFQLPVIRDLLAWCQVAGRGTRSDAAFYRLLCAAVRPNTARKFYRVHHRHDLTSRLELLRPQEKESPDLAELYRLIDHFREQALGQGRTAAEMVVEICRATRLLSPYVRRYELTDRTALANAGDFISRALAFNKRHPDNNSLQNFTRYMETLERSNVIAAREPRPFNYRNAILVQTIHKAKGLEYPVVIIPYNQVQRFPLNYRPGKFVNTPPANCLQTAAFTIPDPKELHRQEERRLFYVAMTRAKDELLLLAPPKRTSPFIKEIPATLIRTTTMAEAKTTPNSAQENDLRIIYEQRLAAAISQDQYDLSRDLVNALERLQGLARGKAVTWGDSDWETELQARLKKQPLPAVPEHPVLSASAIETYDKCPLKYQLVYIDNIPETAEKPQLVFGNIIHQVLEYFHHDNLHTERELLDLLERFWQSEGFDYESREISFKKQGVDLLKRYYRYIQANPPEVLQTEYKFKFELNFCTIIGKIDRIDRIADGLKVVDYKTGKTVTKPQNSLQLAVYCLYLTQHTTGELLGLPAQASLLFLRESDQPEHSHSFSGVELEGFKAQINHVVEGIKNREFEFKKGRHCDWCDYKTLLCPAWEEEN